MKEKAIIFDLLNCYRYNKENNKEYNMSKESAIDCFQVKSLSTDRFIQKIGDVKNIFDIHSTITKTFNPLYKLN